MQATALGHRLETLSDGLTTFSDGKPVPIPLVETSISIEVVSGLAFVRTARIFRNAENAPIEAVLTFPVGFEAVVTGLTATIDGRRMIGLAKERTEAREGYEAAIDKGKLSVLHEETLRGIHVLSVGALQSGAEVLVELAQIVPLSDADGIPFLRLPVTAGQVYGTSPLLPSDDLVTSEMVRHEAMLSVTVDVGRALLDQQELASDAAVPIVLDRAVELVIQGGSFGSLSGVTADGRAVQLTLQSVGASQSPLALHILVDRSGSTNSLVGDGKASVWQAIRDGLITELSELRDDDCITLWQFDDDYECLGTSHGPNCGKLATRLEAPNGGTELAGAIRAAIAQNAKDILVLTDGQTWAHLVEELKGAGSRISAILVGPGSLDANIGHLCALTGGQVLYAPGQNVTAALRSGFAALRQSTSALEGYLDDIGPKQVITTRGGITLSASWSDARSEGSTSDAIGRFSASLALPMLSAQKAVKWASAHGLCTHLTSLVLVDEVGNPSQGLSLMRKVPLTPAHGSHSDQIVSRMARNVSDPSVGENFIAPRFKAQSKIDVGPIFRLQASLEPSRLSKLKRVTGSEMRKSVLHLAPPPTLFTRLLFWLRGFSQDRFHAAFLHFPWDKHCDALLHGDFTMLTVEQTKALEETIQRMKKVDPQRYRNAVFLESSHVFFLGLIAQRCGTISGTKFAKLALGRSYIGPENAGRRL